MKEKIQWVKGYETLCIKILRWVVFGVIASLLPYWFVLSLYEPSDLAISELDSLLDLLLISIAVLVNTVSLLWDKEKKIAELFKISSIIFFIITMFYGTYLYGSLFDQTIWNNKTLEEYNKLAISLEESSENSSNSSDYEDIKQQLTNIKSIIDTVGTKTEKLKQFRSGSKTILIVATIVGISVECFDDRSRREKKLAFQNEGTSALLDNNTPQNPPNTKGCE